MLELNQLEVAYRLGKRRRSVVRAVSLQIGAGERYGLVGESGSGKSTLALAALGALGPTAEVRGQIVVAGQSLAELNPAALRQLWRERVRLVPQNPLTALNPSLRIAAQVAEALPEPSAQTVLDWLHAVRLADPSRVARAFPHELSGGMLQRVVLAMALGAAPQLLILDEPTTNLDVTTEAAILDLVSDLSSAQGSATLLVSHNLAVVAGRCQRVGVLYAGELVEEAPAEQLFAAPQHPYTALLLASVPPVGRNQRAGRLAGIAGRLPNPDAPREGCAFAPRCPLAVARCHREQPALHAHGAGRVACHRPGELALAALSAPPAAAAANAAPQALLDLQALEVHFPLPNQRVVRAVDQVDLHLARGQTLGVVGESGSGKTTLARTVIGLVERTGGSLRLRGVELPPRLQSRSQELLRQVQMVFQNPEDALNPYLTVGEALRRPLLRLRGLQGSALASEIGRLLVAVGLPAEYAQRLPQALSGGEKQRVAIARALAAEPDLVILDEAVSALDVSVQAGILNLLADLQAERQPAYLFISHDLGVVSYLADAIAVVYLGRVVEVGPAAAVLGAVSHPYTAALLASAPQIGRAPAPQRHLSDEIPNASDLPSGCRFHPRCPRALAVCRTSPPPLRDLGGGHLIECHLSPAELAGKE